MTSPDVHQTGPPKAATGLKDQLLQERIFQKVPIKPKAPDHPENTILKTAAKNAPFQKVDLTSHQPPALVAVRKSRTRQRAGRTAAARLIVIQAVPENHFQKANHIAAGLPAANHARPEALKAKGQATKSLSLRAANPQQVPTVPTKNPGEALAEIKNIRRSLQPAAALKAQPTNHTTQTGRRVIGITMANRGLPKPCAAVNQKRKAPTTA